ncbi:MAG: hypothetical protein U9N85_07670 [Bacteroidota bacterium]|nr:hypothetical protein [Bacteroidota bacterium]
MVIKYEPLPRILTFTFLLFFMRPLAAQSVEETLISADSLLTVQKAELAVESYKRTIFFAGRNNKTVITIQAVNSCINNSYYSEAALLIRYYENNYDCRPDSLVDLQILKAKNLLLMKQYDDALRLSHKLSCSYSENDTDHRIILLKALAHYGLNAVDSARNYFVQYLEEYNTPVAGTIDSLLFQSIQNPEQYIKNASNLSVILPGLGQLFVGEYSEAANSFLLNGFLFFLLHDLTVNYAWYSGLLSVYPWYERYSKSSVVKAKELAEQKVKDNKQEILNQIIRVLME